MIWSPGRALVACLAIVLGGLRFARPRTIGMGGFKVPQHWAAFGDAPYMALFGFFLGMGLVTTVPSTVMVVLAAWVWHAHNLVLAAAVFWSFALGRLGTTVAAWALSRRSQEEAFVTANEVERRIAGVARVEAAVAIALGFVLVLESVI
jgi:hypothetical protein